MAPTFLSTDEVPEIHTDQIARYGGMAGVRDLGRLQSALAQPQATFGGQFLHADLFEMAAAYLFHMVGNHPFVEFGANTLRIHRHAFAEDGVGGYPAVNSASIVADPKPMAVDRFDQVEVFPAVDFA